MALYVIYSLFRLAQFLGLKILPRLFVDREGLGESRTGTRQYLDMVHNSLADVTMRVAWIFSWRMKMRVNLLGLYM